MNRHWYSDSDNDNDNRPIDERRVTRTRSKVGKPRGAESEGEQGEKGRVKSDELAG